MRDPEERVYIGLGSNLGDRAANLAVGISTNDLRTRVSEGRGIPGGAGRLSGRGTNFQAAVKARGGDWSMRFGGLRDAVARARSAAGLESRCPSGLSLGNRAGSYAPPRRQRIARAGGARSDGSLQARWAACRRGAVHRRALGLLTERESLACALPYFLAIR